MFKIKFVTVSLIVALVAGYMFVQRVEIGSLKKQNKQFETKLIQCKKSNEAKSFESMWSDEFQKVLINTDTEEVLKDNISTQNDSNRKGKSDENSFIDAF